MLSFEEVIHRHDKLIYNLARRLMGNAEDAEDVSQEVAIKIYRNLDKCKGEEYLPAWISRITHNACMDALRKKKGKQTDSLDNVLDLENGDVSRQIADDAPSPEELLLQKEVSKQIEEALQKLSVSYRSLIILRDVQGHSYDEVAQITGLSLGTVKSKIFRGRAKLREILLSARLNSLC